MCTYKQISVKIKIDRSTRASLSLSLSLSFFFFFFFGHGSGYFVISIFGKKGQRFGPISLHSLLQSQPGPGCYLSTTEVQLFSKWICRFLKGDEEGKKRGKNQVFNTTLPKLALCVPVCVCGRARTCMCVCVDRRLGFPILFWEMEFNQRREKGNFLSFLPSFIHIQVF